MSKPVITSKTETRTVYRGVAAAARYLGCSAVHLTFVLHGQRKPSEKLRRGLARLGITETSEGKPFAEVK